MAEMEKTMAPMNQKLTEPGTWDGAQGHWALPETSWMTSDSYTKKHLQIPERIVAVIGVTNLEWGRGKEGLGSCSKTWEVWETH